MTYTGSMGLKSINAIIFTILILVSSCSPERQINVQHKNGQLTIRNHEMHDSSYTLITKIFFIEDKATGTKFKLFTLDKNMNQCFSDLNADFIGVLPIEDEEYDLNGYLTKGFQGDFSIKVNDEFYEVTNLDCLGEFDISGSSHSNPYFSLYTKYPLDIYLKSIHEGDSINLKELRSDSTYFYIYFWGTWCPGCIAGLPYLDSLRSLPNLEVLSVNFGDSESKIDEFVAFHDIEITEFGISIGNIKKLGISSFPGGILINQNRVLYLNVPPKRILTFFRDKPENIIY